MKEGVYYRREDYAGFWRRALVDAVDLTVIGLLFLAACIAGALVLPNWMPETTMASAGLIWLGYFVVLRRSRFGTLGYRMGRVRLVGLDGLAPGWWPLVVRASVLALGPLNFVLDLTLFFDDRHRQTLRDKVAGIYVIKAGAQPVGRGRLIGRYWCICEYNIFLTDVEVEEDASAQIS